MQSRGLAEQFEFSFPSSRTPDKQIYLNYEELCQARNDFPCFDVYQGKFNFKVTI